MPNELVIDTNVLVYASNNDDYAKKQDCINFIDNLIISNEVIFIDLSIDPNKGIIAHEYYKHLNVGDYGYVLLEKLLSENRIMFIVSTVHPHINKKIYPRIKKEKAWDRVFVRVAYKTANKILVSHDYEDFTISNREYFRKEIGVHIIEAGDYIN